MTPATKQLTTKNSFSLPFDQAITRRPIICAAPVLNIAIPTIMEDAIRSTMLLENPEKASSNEQTPNSTARMQPIVPTAAEEMREARKKKTQVIRRNSPIRSVFMKLFCLIR